MAARKIAAIATVLAASIAVPAVGQTSDPVLVVAHRGCWKDAPPENSLAAIRACVAMGVDVIELDVRRTADGVLILMHDSTVDRTTDGHGAVSDLTYPQIRKLRLRERKGGKAARLTREAPPTFEAAMRAAKGKVLVNLDAKADVYDAAFAVLERTGTRGQIIMKRRVSAGDPDLATERPFDQVMAMPIVDQLAGSASDLLATQLSPGSVAAELIFTDLDYLKAARLPLTKAGKRIWVNSLQPEQAAGLCDRLAVQDPDGIWGKLIAEGVTIIQTDEPRLLIRYLDTQGRRVKKGKAAAYLRQR